MAHKKGQGSSRNGRDSNPKMRGIKLYGGQHAKPGSILCRQNGTKWHAGKNVGIGRDWTLFALAEGDGGVRPGRPADQRGPAPRPDLRPSLERRSAAWDGIAMFVDRVTIHVKGGDGGNGCLGFRREKYVPRGGPNGGDGGSGGHVIVRAVEGLTNLAHLSFQRHWKAERGEHGQGSDCHGRGAEDLVIEVPAGTIVRDRDRGHVLRDLKRAGDDGDRRPGRPGRARQQALQVVHQPAPRGRSSRGSPGEERWITLELKVIADVGLDRPAERRQVDPALADLAGPPRDRRLSVHDQVSESRHRSRRTGPRVRRGRHPRPDRGGARGPRPRARVPPPRRADAAARPPGRRRCRLDGSDPVANYRTIRSELEKYSPALAARPELLVVTKLDLTGAEAARDRLAAELCREVLRSRPSPARACPP